MSDTLRDQQLAFTAHMRDPAHNAAPEGIEDRRLAVYRDLLFNSLEGLLASNFPVIKQTLGDDAWRELVRAFYATHRCSTPHSLRQEQPPNSWRSMESATPTSSIPEPAAHSRTV